MSAASALTQTLLEAQKADGGWGYLTSLSWTEPTAFALLALAALDRRDQAYERGCRYLLSQQRPDGGWSPNAQVPISNAVTSAALLALGDFAPQSSRERGLTWLVAQVAPELTPWQRIEFWWQDRPGAEAVMGGSPWFPGTASWVSPTVMTVLSLAQAQSQQPHGRFSTYCFHGKQYLLSRRCKNGGWNHGGSQLHSEESLAYPEMTGMALLAFDRSDRALISGDLDLAEKMLADPQSGEAQSWLQLCLTKHGRDQVLKESRFPCRTMRDVSLRILAQQASSPNNHLLLNTV